MSVVIVAIVAGALTGLIRGGRFGAVLSTPLRAWPLLVIGVGLQAAPSAIDARFATPAALASYATLALFGLANLHLVGMPIFILGLAANAVPLALNDGMPVRERALVAADIIEPGEAATVTVNPPRRFEQPGDRLVGLADVIPVPALRTVVSFGDLVLAAGAMNIALRVVHPPRRRRSQVRPPRKPRPTPGSDDSNDDDEVDEVVDLRFPDGAIDLANNLAGDMAGHVPTGDPADAPA